MSNKNISIEERLLDGIGLLLPLKKHFAKTGESAKKQNKIDSIDKHFLQYTRLAKGSAANYNLSPLIENGKGSIIISYFDGNSLALAYWQDFSRKEYFMWNFKLNTNYKKSKQFIKEHNLSLQVRSGSRGGTYSDNKLFRPNEPSGEFPRTSLLVEGVVNEENVDAAIKVINYFEGQENMFSSKYLIE